MPGENGMGIDPSEKDPRGLLGYAREFVRQHPNSILGAFLSIVLFSLGVFFEARSNDQAVKLALSDQIAEAGDAAHLNALSYFSSSTEFEAARSGDSELVLHRVYAEGRDALASSAQSITRRADSQLPAGPGRDAWAAYVRALEALYILVSDEESAPESRPGWVADVRGYMESSSSCLPPLERERDFQLSDEDWDLLEERWSEGGLKYAPFESLYPKVFEALLLRQGLVNADVRRSGTIYEPWTGKVKRWVRERDGEGSVCPQAHKPSS